jgi:hypothetical protein
MNSNEIAVLNILNQHRGKANAIPYHDLAGLVCLGQRALRRVVEGLIREHQVPVCTSYDRGDGGYYLPRTAREVREASHKLRKHGVAILCRASALEKISLAEMLGQLSLEIKKTKSGENYEPTRTGTPGSASSPG